MIYWVLLGVLMIGLSYSFIPTILLKQIKYNSNLKNRNGKKIALTFDDGIDYIYTPKILDLLKEENIRANFFIMGETVEENLEILERIQREGHTVGVHCFEHKSLMLKGISGSKNEIEDSYRILERYNIRSKLYRPPHGHVNIASLFFIRKMGLKLVLWDVIVGDWKEDNTRENISRDILNNVENGSIICLHDGRGELKAPSRTIEALKITIPLLKERGYRFVKLDDYYGI